MMLYKGVRIALFEGEVGKIDFDVGKVEVPEVYQNYLKSGF